MHERRYNAEIERLRSPERIERLEIQTVIDLCLEDTAVQSVLDVGTGSGLFAEEFARKVATVTGIDANLEMVKASKELVPTARFQQATAESIPFLDKSFDLVFMALVLHEVDDLRKALSESRRCAKRSVIVLEWPYRQEESGPPLEHRLKSEDIISMAKSVGFTATELIPLNVLQLYRFSV